MKRAAEAAQEFEGLRLGVRRRGDTMTGTLTGVAFAIGTNTLDTTEWAFLDGQDQAVKTTSSPTFASPIATGYFQANPGASYIQYDGANYWTNLEFSSAPALTANHNLYFDIQNTDHNITLTADNDITLGDWFDQSVKTTASPTFANMIITSGGDIKPSANSTTALNIAQADGTNFVVFDTTNKFTGFQFAVPIAPVSIGGTATDTQLTVGTIDGGASFHSASANNFNFATGARYVGGSWIAKATTCSSFTPNGNQIRFYSASGQVVGNAVTFQYVAYFDEDGLYLQSGKNVVLPSNGYLKQASGSYQIVLVLQSASALAANRALYFDIDGGQRTFKITSTGGLTTARTLIVDCNNADRTISLSGNPTLADWFDQSVKTTANPTFAGNLNSSDVEITDATKGVVLRAPNASRWRITVDNSGILSTASI